MEGKPIRQVLRRTFKAKKYPVGSKEREELNKDPLTSEYYPGNKYLLREPAPPGLPQKYYNKTYRTKREAEGNL